MKFHRTWHYTKLTVPLLLLLIAGGWLPDGMRELDWWSLGWGAAFFILGTVIAYHLRREYLSIHAAMSRQPRPHRVLIMPISSISGKLEKRGDSYYWQAAGKGEVKLESSLGEFTKQDLKSNNLPWQQTLRGIEAHSKRLKRVYLIGSAGETGSHNNISDCSNLIMHYCSEVKVTPWKNAIDFEDIELLCKSLTAAIKDAAIEYSEHEIMIDATGGQKTTSIAAALVTINNAALEFQYVSTSKPHEVLSINTNAVENELK